jgi:hypothetical protein
MIDVYTAVSAHGHGLQLKSLGPRREARTDRRLGAGGQTIDWRVVASHIRQF